MSRTINGLLEHCRVALKNNVQYIYGAKMKVMTYAEIKALQNTYGKSYVWDSDLNKAGKLCCDCSGLISSYTGISRSSSTYASTATESATIAQLKADWSKYVGWGIWLKGHIGVVSDTEGYYYAMDGSARNMVHLPISKNSWVKVIKLKDIDYDYKEENKEMVETISLKINGKEIKADAIVKDGETFLKLRAFENAGFKVGYNSENKMRTVDNEIKELSVVVDGKETSVEAVNIEDHNYVPIRSLAAALDIKVGYENKKVTLEK
jgi:hypothetical protein